MATRKKSDRCWPGYEPVPGKEQHEQGSCRKKPASESTTAEKDFQSKRKRQLAEWQKQHPKTRPTAAQHLSAPATAKTPKKKSAPKEKS
jgi:hypothetical protein